MKAFSLLSLAILCVYSTVAQILPSVYYPPDGIYYIYNVQFKEFFNNFGFKATEGNPIAAFCYVSQKTNEWWLVETVGSTSGNHMVTMRVMSTVQGNPAAGGYAANENGSLVHSKTASTWTLKPVPNSCSQFMIVDGNTAITQAFQNPDGVALTVEAINQNAANQQWAFIPFDQITNYFPVDPNGGCDPCQFCPAPL
ncbi:uncharacterized protein FOMMEDRAFT_159530 [Fomitiporia mediterranea MF3/22]|uniref:uncharacterized protein n=1 Tax=Fomitiporia mediterranea (strain MF3/22) TaxID=694068 RepID=UPI00044096EA|nr:uncharacterized protein FOMMEDRAFT_159530 [Fomitiporia mediterranea MF3/22]EJC99953.1 hypothetical protein FOMMEDRAFT_159530 [Fomitiporia mediterranea MF3/22]